MDSLEESHQTVLEGLHGTEFLPNVLRRPETEKGKGGNPVFCELEKTSWLSMAKNQKPQFLENALVYLDF